MTGDTVVGSHGPVALSSKLGWLLSGPLDSHSDTVLTQSHLVLNRDFIDQPSSLESDALITMLHHFWNTESIGILDEDSDKATPAFLEQMLFKQDQYEVGLPWK